MGISYKGKCKCGADADVGFLAYGKEPTVPYCFPCLELDFPETKEDIAKLPAAAEKYAKLKAAN